MSDSKNRQINPGVLSGFVGIGCNLLLSTSKFIVGALSGSLSITADGANNLSDAGSSIVTIIGSALARKPADREHPFGHGRAESVSALVVSVLILLTGAELAKNSIERILSPTPVSFEWIYVTVMIFSISVKLFMAFFNRTLYRKYQISSLRAVMQDSINDCLATGMALVSLFLTHTTGFNRIDGIAGLLVSFFVLYSGVDLLKSFSGILLGNAPSEELVTQIKEILLRDPRILSIHDISLHEYGSQKRIGSVHVEISAELGAVRIHEIIDGIEEEILEKTDTQITIHIDPVDLNNQQLQYYKKMTTEILQHSHPEYHYHDLKIQNSEAYTKLRFDLVVPYEEKKKSEEITAELSPLFLQFEPDIRLSITVEHEL